VKIRWLIHIPGAVEGHEEGAHPGDVWDVPDDAGARYCYFRYAVPVVDRKEERAVPPKAEERVADDDSVSDPPEQRDELATKRRGPGRPPKNA
jgi:hypothetical protein